MTVAWTVSGVAAGAALPSAPPPPSAAGHLVESVDAYTVRLTVRDRERNIAEGGGEMLAVQREGMRDESLAAHAPLSKAEVEEQVHGPVHVLRVKLVEKRGHLIDFLSRHVPADDLLLGRDALLQAEHRRVEVAV